MNKKEAGVSTKIRVVPGRRALYHLLANGGFEQIEFLNPPPWMRREDRQSARGSLIACRC